MFDLPTLDPFQYLDNSNDRLSHQGTSWGFLIQLTTLEQSHSMINEWVAHQAEATNNKMASLTAINSAILESMTPMDFQKRMSESPLSSRKIPPKPESPRLPRKVPSVLNLRNPAYGFTHASCFLIFFFSLGLWPSFGNLIKSPIDILRFGHLALSHHSTLTLTSSKIWQAVHPLPLTVVSFLPIHIVQIMAYQAIFQTKLLSKLELNSNQDRKLTRGSRWGI